MQTTEASSRYRLPVRGLVLSEKALIAALLAAFFVLHVLAGTFLQRADAEGAASTRDSNLRLYD